MCRSGATRWRGTRRLSGRSLRGASPRPASILTGRGHLDRRHQQRADCRESHGEARRQAARVLGGRHHGVQLVRLGQRAEGQCSAEVREPAVCGLCAGCWRTRLFAPRYPSPWLYPPGNADATSLYDTSQLRATLERLVDFDRLNAGATRLSIGAVNSRKSNQ
jgi:hypothetical protein